MKLSERHDFEIRTKLDDYTNGLDYMDIKQTSSLQNGIWSLLGGDKPKKESQVKIWFKSKLNKCINRLELNGQSFLAAHFHDMEEAINFDSECFHAFLFGLKYWKTGGAYGVPKHFNVYFQYYLQNKTTEIFASESNKVSYDTDGYFYSGNDGDDISTYRETIGSSEMPESLIKIFHSIGSPTAQIAFSAVSYPSPSFNYSGQPFQGSTFIWFFSLEF